jgi:mono/diheme cytochrome c family protein
VLDETPDTKVVAMKSKRFGFGLACVLAAGLAAACGGDDGGGDDVDPATCTDTYELYAKGFFATNCNSCHAAAVYKASGGGEIQLDSLALVKEHKEHVIEHSVELEMPIMPYLTQGLPEADRQRLKKWYDCGAK